MKKALTIAGSDSGGGAGIQADLKTFAAFGVYGTSAITAVTAQNTQGVEGIFELSPEFVAKQIDIVMVDIGADVWKTGMLANAEIIDIVAQQAKYYKIKSLIVDPVMLAKSGNVLLVNEAKKTLITKLIPLTLVITPNLHEAEAITGCRIKTVEDMKKAAVILHEMGAKYVVVKGGHLEKRYDAIDVVYEGKRFNEIASPRIQTKNTHGTGCTFASAIASGIAKGQSVFSATKRAKKYIDVLLKNASNFHIGHGFGPLNHFPKRYLNCEVNS